MTCCRCGYEWDDVTVTHCSRCYPKPSHMLRGDGVVKPSQFVDAHWEALNRVRKQPDGTVDDLALKVEFNRILDEMSPMRGHPSPTIDVLDLDRSALRALEEIANG